MNREKQLLWKISDSQLWVTQMYHKGVVKIIYEAYNPPMKGKKPEWDRFRLLAIRKG